MSLLPPSHPQSPIPPPHPPIPVNLGDLSQFRQKKLDLSGQTLLDKMNNDVETCRTGRQEVRCDEIKAYENPGNLSFGADLGFGLGPISPRGRVRSSPLQHPATWTYWPELSGNRKRRSIPKRLRRFTDERWGDSWREYPVHKFQCWPCCPRPRRMGLQRRRLYRTSFDKRCLQDRKRGHSGHS